MKSIPRGRIPVLDPYSISSNKVLGTKRVTIQLVKAMTGKLSKPPILGLKGLVINRPRQRIHIRSLIHCSDEISPGLQVVDDVLNGLILPEAASEIYGVDVAEDGSFLENFRRGQKRLIGGKSGPNSGLIPN